MMIPALPPDLSAAPMAVDTVPAPTASFVQVFAALAVELQQDTRLPAGRGLVDLPDADAQIIPDAAIDVQVADVGLGAIQAAESPPEPRQTVPIVVPLDQSLVRAVQVDVRAVPLASDSAHVAARAPDAARSLPAPEPFVRDRLTLHSHGSNAVPVEHVVKIMLPTTGQIANAGGSTQGSDGAVPRAAMPAVEIRAPSLPVARDTAIALLAVLPNQRASTKPALPDALAPIQQAPAPLSQTASLVPQAPAPLLQIAAPLPQAPAPLLNIALQHMPQPVPALAKTAGQMVSDVTVPPDTAHQSRAKLSDMSGTMAPISGAVVRATPPDGVTPIAAVVLDRHQLAPDAPLMSALDHSKAAPTTPPPLLGADPVRQVTQQLAVAVTHSPNGQAELALNPSELGRVRITVHTGDGVVTVQIVAERPETTDLLRRHIDVLAQDFRAIGYQNIAFSFGDQGNRPMRQQPTFLASDGGDDADPAPLPAPDQTMIARSGLDLRL